MSWLSDLPNPRLEVLNIFFSSLGKAYAIIGLALSGQQAHRLLAMASKQPLSSDVTL